MKPFLDFLIERTIEDLNLVYNANKICSGSNVHDIKQLLSKYKGAVDTIKMLSSKDEKHPKLKDLYDIKDRAEKQLRAEILKHNKKHLRADFIY